MIEIETSTSAVAWDKVPKNLIKVYSERLEKITQLAIGSYSHSLACKFMLGYTFFCVGVLLVGTRLHIDIFAICFINMVFAGALAAANQLAHYVYKHKLAKTISSHNDTVKQIQEYVGDK